MIATAGSFLLSLGLLLQGFQAASDEHHHGTSSETVSLWTWAHVEDAHQAASSTGQPSADLQIDIVLRVDPLTIVMLTMVTFVSLLVTIFAAGYMQGDRGYWRFFSYIGLFIFSMTMLVSVSNLLLLFVLWEAVGMCSYLLIGFWYEKPEAAAAGKKAFLVNRVGDFGFMLAIFLIWCTYGTL
ncbi:MAG: NADH-quinone oxidoreductase subunit L, partial [Planctomycetaceae bacterium]|nr:NADH-quinone oxidoreductase subunit L [Planctomycetaceae bacterium]